MGNGNELLWTVEGDSLTDPSNQDREISVTTNKISVDVWLSVLTIRALPINDGIGVACIVLSPNFASKGAKLTVEGQHRYSIRVHCNTTFDMTGILSVESLQFNLNLTSSSNWLSWAHPFKNYPLSYHIYIENQYGQLLYNDITDDTSYELYNLTVCDIYTATVIVHSGEYSSNSTSTQGEYSGGKFLFDTIRILTFI